MAIKNRLNDAAEVLKETAFVQNNEYRIISEDDDIVFNFSLWEMNMSEDDSFLCIADGFINSSSNMHKGLKTKWLKRIG